MSRRQRLVTIRFFCDRAVPWPRQSTVFLPSRAVPGHSRDNLRSLLVHSHSCHTIIARVFSEHCRSIPDNSPHASLEHSTNSPQHSGSISGASQNSPASIFGAFQEISHKFPRAFPEHPRSIHARSGDDRKIASERKNRALFL